MKFSNIILTTTLSVLLLDTGFVLGKKPRKGRGKGPGKRGKLIENQCEALDLEDEEVDKKECMQTLNCDVENKVCINFVPTVCGEITDPTKEDCKKNGCLFVEGVGSGFADTCEDKLIDNQCGAIESTDGKVDKKECMQTLNCDVENKICMPFVPTACDEITDPTKEDCRKNGCLFDMDADTCEVDPCIAACVEEEDTNTCCLKRCQTVDKCSKANSKQGKCEKKKKKNKKECVYDSETNVCSRAVEGCYAFNGQEMACDDAEEGCVYDACTEQCSKE